MTKKIVKKTTTTKTKCKRINGTLKSDELAQVFGISLRRVQQLTQEGTIHTIKVPGETGRRYDLLDSTHEYIRFLSDKAHGRERNETKAQLEDQKLKAEIALKESQGELHKLRTDIARGKYISVEEVQLDYKKFFIVLKKFVLGVPNRIVGMVGSYVDPVTARALEKDMTNEAAEMLRSFVLAAKEENDGNESESGKT